MYVRVVTRQFQPGKTAEALQRWQDKVLPVLKQQKGFNGACLTGDRNTGKGVHITFWETEADATAMDTSGVFQQIVGMLDHYHVTSPTREQYEVLVQV